MEKYLISLLELNNRVIVPDLGAFIVRQQEPKELVFNDLLAFDDGMLCDRLMHEEKLSRTEAQNRIKQYVEKAKKTLEKGDVHHIENLGSLKMDASSKIEFSTAGSAAGKATTSKAPSEEIPEAESSEEDVKAKGSTAGKGSEKVTAKKATTKKTAPEKTTAKKTAADKTPVEAAPIIPAKPDIKLNGEDKGTDKVPVPEKKEKVTKPKKAASKPKDKKKEAEDEGSFVLAEGDEKVDVDATSEDTPIEPDGEEPPFQIEDSVKDEADATNKTETEAEPAAKKKPEPVAEPVPEGEPETGEKPDQVSDPLQVAEAKAEKEKDMEMVPEEVPVEEPVQAMKTREKPIYKFDTPEPEETPAATYTPSYQKKRRIWPWIAGIVFLIIVLLAAAWFFFPEQVDSILKREMTGSLTGEETDLSVTGIDSPADEELEEAADGENEGAAAGEEMETAAGEEPETSMEVPDETAEAESRAQGVPDDETGTGGPAAAKMYYVVAGCFADIKNAENYERLLRDQGYNASIFGTWKNLHAVCFSSHTSRQAALEELRHIRGSYDPKAWLLYY